ncbi:hypothetical protein [Rothia halotolerans]|uniref:hypothetical protein n=1 Tax=Rothia halotolerans TaxID=405770 RepID=UPI001EE02705|nr:hypothetical protein [Rothia halotolerans]
MFILVDGTVMTRDEIAGSLDGMLAWESYEIGDAGLAEPFVALMSSTYRRIDGEPRLALYQQTTVTH